MSRLKPISEERVASSVQNPPGHQENMENTPSTSTQLHQQSWDLEFTPGHYSPRSGSNTSSSPSQIANMSLEELSVVHPGFEQLLDQLTLPPSRAPPWSETSTQGEQRPPGEMRSPSILTQLSYGERWLL